MFTPSAFVESDLHYLDRLIDADPFVTVVTIDDQGTPAATPMPVLYRREGDRVLVEGHWARANPQANGADRALVIVHGPHAYVSPRWYPDAQAAARVPTWNYATAHLSGTLERFDDEDALGDLVDRLSAHFEGSSADRWRFDAGRTEYRSQLRGIVGFRLVPSRIELKFKLNQDHPPANRRAVADALARHTHTGARDVAALMHDRITPQE